MIEPRLTTFVFALATLAMTIAPANARDYTLTVDMPNGCPGQITVAWFGAGRYGSQAFVFGDRPGSRTIPRWLPCAGTVLGLDGRLLLVDPPGFIGTRGGSGQLHGIFQAGALCEHWIQLIKLPTCETSNIAQIN